METEHQIQYDEIDVIEAYHPRCLSAVPMDLEEILAGIEANTN